MGRLAACLAVGMTACFSPQPPIGAQCANGRCPSGLECIAATNTCELPGTQPMLDAPMALVDAAYEDTPPTPDGQACFGNGLVMVCPSMAVSGPLSIGDAVTINTTTSPSCIAYTGTSGLCVLAGTNVTIAQSVTGIGTKPLVILATDSLTVEAAATISVASKRGMPAGAGANPGACVAGAAATGVQGGAGGSFGGRGGRGADLESPQGPLASPALPAPVMSLRGGCAGGNGAGSDPGAGGAGGGAVYLIAKNTLTVNGTINASGAGGNRPTNRAGGGGGGSGGMIVLDAATVSVAAGGAIYANGGGGAEGATNNQDGNAGADPVMPATAATGGTGGAPHGGAGGAGAAGMAKDGEAGAIGNQCSGGGSETGKGGGGGAGGGGAGVVRIFSPMQSVTGAVSPAPN